MKQSNQSGFILTVTLALIVLCMFLSMYIFNKGYTFARYTTVMANQEKARQLAYGGLQLAIGQLSTTPAQEPKSTNQQAQSPQNAQASTSDGLHLLKTLLPILNKTQKFILKQAIEGVNGTISLTIGSEEGKININKLYDFEKHTFIGQGQPTGDNKLLFQELFALSKEKLKVDLFEEFEKFLKERKYPLDDVTQLLLVKGFDVFKNSLFYDPAGKKDTIYLTDIFTVWSSKKEIEPWLFSESLKHVMQMKSATETAVLEQALKNFKEQSDWKQDWNKSLKLIYGKEYAGLPKAIAPLLNPTFAPKMFWVLSQASIAGVTVSLWAILEREKGSGKDAPVTVHIRSIYLI